MKNKSKIILASKSPRRSEILSMIKLNFQIVPSEVKEKIDENFKHNEIVESLSRQKAEIISFKYPDHIVIGADTIVVSDGKIFGKPKDFNESRKMLQSLSGNSHKVITGVTICNKNSEALKTFNEVTEVFVRRIPKDQIEYYINNFNTFEKSGGYGIQEWFSIWIEKINGCYFNVMGLPISKFYKHYIEFQKLIK